jgi:hypothetical protein
MLAEITEGKVGIVVRGVASGDLRRRALCECERIYGPGGYRLCSESFRPCMVSLGGHVRLWEGRFEAEADTAASN